jgi:hypothetical protein
MRFRLFTQLALAFIVLSVSITHAASIIVSVDSQTGPWLWVDGGLNTTFDYGFTAPDLRAPSGTTNIDSSSGISFAPGGLLTITYLDGLICVFAAPCDPVLLWDAAGSPVDTVFKNDDPGSSGNGFPSQYTPLDWDTRLGALMGTFADNTGSIVGTPFEVGLGRSVTIPVGATRLQLGINDDWFNDNTGAFRTSVEGPTATAIPEPSSMLLLMISLPMLGLIGRCYRSVRSE